MLANKLFRNAHVFAKYLTELRDRRRNSNAKHLPIRHARRSPGPGHRNSIFDKTAGHCHLCGGPIAEGEPWTANHILAHAHGGGNAVDNYLPAHALCNGYRWYYDPEEFQWILKLGVWFRSRIAAGDMDALKLADRFVRYDAARAARKKG